MSFKLMGIKVKISLFFIFITLVALLTDFYRQLIAIFFALGIHELGHLLTAREFGLNVESIELLPFGGKIKIKNLDEASLEQEMLTVIAGPMVNFAVATILMYMLNKEMMPKEFGNILINYQLILGFFNMIPALPLDGGRIFVLWLRQFTNYTSAVRIASRLGKILSVVFSILALYGLLFKKSFINLLIMSIILFYQAVKESRQAPYLFMKQIARKKQNLLNKEFFPLETIVAMENTPIKKILYQFIPQKYYIIYILDDEMNVRKSFTETEIINKILETGLDIKFKDLL